MATTNPYLRPDGGTTNVPTEGADLDRCPPMRRVIAYNMAWELGLSIQTCIEVGRGEITCIYIFALVCVERSREDEGKCHL